MVRSFSMQRMKLFGCVSALSGGKRSNECFPSDERLTRAESLDDDDLLRRFCDDDGEENISGCFGVYEGLFNANTEAFDDVFIR